jgi:hypothetical protein
MFAFVSLQVVTLRTVHALTPRAQDRTETFSYRKLQLKSIM